MKKAVQYFLVSSFLGVLFFISCLTPPATAATSIALISGTVQDDSGKPLSGAVVALFTAQPGQVIGGSLLKSVTTDLEGHFKADVIPGMYRLRAMADGFRPTFTLITLDAANKITHNFALKRVGTLVEKRGDKADYRWIGRSVPRSILHYQEPDDEAETVVADEIAENAVKPEAALHGFLQLTSLKAGEAEFSGANFALSKSFSENFELALLGQGGVGTAAPQRVSAIAALRPTANHQVTVMTGYGQTLIRDHHRPLQQFSFAALDAWQVNKPLLLILGFDYSTFGTFGKGRDSILPRVAVQYTPNSRTHLNAALTPQTASSQQLAEGFDSENIHAKFETQHAEIALSQGEAVSNRSRRLEMGFERVLGEDGDSSIEATAFYDVISGHGIGVLALPLEASPENQTAIEQVVHQVVAMNGAARGLRLMYAKRFSDYLTASVGYSFGRGTRFNDAYVETSSPAQMFTGSNFQVASAKLDLDFTQRTGTRISTVLRLSPAAVVFAIDPFAGRVGVYDPNLSIYLTQALPSFGLPIKCQALIDLRNLLNQTNGIESDKAQLLAAQSHRSVRGAISFQW